jgi:hypothetical protein
MYVLIKLSQILLRDFQKIKSLNIRLPSISLIRVGRPCPYNFGEFIYWCSLNTSCFLSLVRNPGIAPNS